MGTNLELLKERFNRGERLKFVFFWGHTAKGASVGKECLSQWYPASFEVDQVHYPSAEHFMMAEKARLFGSEDVREKILASDNPGAAKKLGRAVRDFDNAVWEQHRFGIVVAANLAKFGKNPELGSFLVGTGDRVLVEASPRDRIWGIGLAQNQPECENPNLWCGLNLLGFALMEARSELTANKSLNSTPAATPPPSDAANRRAG